MNSTSQMFLMHLDLAVLWYISDDSPHCFVFVFDIVLTFLGIHNPKGATSALHLARESTLVLQ